MARLILKSPYLKPGSSKSPGGYLKYIATREGVEMAEDTTRHFPATSEQQKEIDKLAKQHPDSKDSHEYEDYLANPTRGNADVLIQSIYEIYNLPRRDIYLQYIAERPGANGLFTDEGVPIILDQAQKEMNESGSNIWTHIISMRREDAQRLGYDSPDAWMHLLRSQRNMIAQEMKISPENFSWYAAFHNEGHHPHVHMMAYSVDPQEAYLTKKGIETIKSNLAKEIFQQDLLQIYQQQTDLRDELRNKAKDRMEEIITEINSSSFQNPVMEQLLVQLSDKLSKAKGKKQYGYLNAGTKKIVDAIVAELVKESPIQELYSLWYDLREDVFCTYTNKMPDRIPLEQQKEFKSIRNAVVQATLQLHIPAPTDLSEPCLPCVDFSGWQQGNYRDAEQWLCTPGVSASQAEEQLYNAAIRGSIDAVYGMGKLYMETDIQKTIGFFELAAKQGNTYAEYQLGKIYCFGLGMPRNLTSGFAWLRASAEHGNPHAAVLLQYVQSNTSYSAVRLCFGLLHNLALMLQAKGEQQYRQRQSVDRKLKRKIDEKKMAQGQRPTEEHQGIQMV